MIHTKSGIVYFYNGIYHYTGTESVPCPICGGELYVRSSCDRYLRTEDKVQKYRLRIMKCRNCGKYHRELADEMIPYKRLAACTIDKIANASLETHKNYTQTSTWIKIKRWFEWFVAYAKNVYERLKLELNIQVNFAVLTSCEKLKCFTHMVVNSGYFAHHRSE